MVLTTMSDDESDHETLEGFNSDGDAVICDAITNAKAALDDTCTEYKDKDWALHETKLKKNELINSIFSLKNALETLVKDYDKNARCITNDQFVKKSDLKDLLISILPGMLSGLCNIYYLT
jgi:hypothetical protein